MRRQENKDEEVRQKWGEWREEKGWRVWWRKGMRDWGEMWESKGGKHEKSRCHSSFVRIKWWDETGHERKKRREQFNHPLSSIYPSICVSIKQILSTPAVTRVFLTAHTHIHTHTLPTCSTDFHFITWSHFYNWEIAVLITYEAHSSVSVIYSWLIKLIIAFMRNLPSNVFYNSLHSYIPAAYIMLTQPPIN